MNGWFFIIIGFNTVARVSAGGDPCLDYIDIGNPRRSVGYETKESDALLCDYNVVEMPGQWYRFIQYTGGEIPETCVALRKCGTVAPIWMKGTHPSVVGEEANAIACANFGLDTDCCDWSGPIKVKKCQSGPEEFFVYQLARPSGCSAAYCAGDKTPCVKQEEWNPETQMCNGDTASSVAPTGKYRTTLVTSLPTAALVTSRPPMTRVSTSTKGQLTTSYQPTSLSTSRQQIVSTLNSPFGPTDQSTKSPTKTPSSSISEKKNVTPNFGNGHVETTGKSNIAVMAGVAAGCVVIGASVAFVVFYCFCRKHGSKKSEDQEVSPPVKEENYYSSVIFKDGLYDEIKSNESTPNYESQADVYSGLERISANRDSDHKYAAIITGKPTGNMYSQ